MKPKLSADFATFFDHGNVKLNACDPTSRRASLIMTMPCCLLQALTPPLLHAGVVSGLRIHNPITVWFPTVPDSGFNEVAQTIPNLGPSVQSAIKTELERILAIFNSLSQYMINAADLIPILPLGTYVEFEYTIEVDKALEVLEFMQKINVVGAHEVIFGVAVVLHRIIEEFTAFDEKCKLQASNPRT